MDNKFKGFVIVAFVLLFAGMAAGGFYVVKMVSNNVQPNQVEQTVSKAEDIQIFELTEAITTNLISEKDEKSKHVIKVTVGFAINKKSKDYKIIAKEFEEKEILVRDEIIQSLRDQSYESMTKSDAQGQLSEIIVSRISTLLGTQSVEEMYFGDFFVQ